MPPRQKEVKVTLSSSTSSSIIDDSNSNQQNSNNNNNNNNNNNIILYHPKDAAEYVQCNSKGPFMNPYCTKTPIEVNKQLQFNLGQNILNLYNPKYKKLIKLMRYIYKFFIIWFEKYIHITWNTIPVNIRRKLTYIGWKTFLPLHKLILHRTTGISKYGHSIQYHALTTCMSIMKLLPMISIHNIRFCLDQVTACHPYPVTSTVEEIHYNMMKHDLKDIPIPDIQKDHCTVSGLYLHYNNKDNNNNNNNQDNDNNSYYTEYTLLYIYGGAFMAGSPIGNLGPADMFVNKCQLDVYIPEYRLCPEYNIHDLLWDIVLSYRYLYQLRKSKKQDPNKIFLFGISSGAGLITRLIQYFTDIEQNISTLPSYIAPLLSNIHKPIAGTVLVSPYCDYNDDKDIKSSFYQYNKHDLLVSPPVVNFAIPFLNTHMQGERNLHSPINRSFVGVVTPLCVILSEHEACYNEGCDLINKARADGVPVTVGMWRYMCHAWCLMSGFIPEGKHSMDFICQWINERKTVMIDEK